MNIPTPRQIEAALSATSTLDVAMGLASAGAPVFPLIPGSKIPTADSRGYNDATTNPDVVEKWWTGTRGAFGVGWVPARCGLAIVDVDVVHNGDISFSEVTDQHVHAMQHGIITLSQGYHLVFKDRPEKPTPFVNNFAQGIDLRGNGGYLVAAVGYWSKAPFVYQPEWETSGGASEDWELIPECFAAAPARNRNGVTAGDYFERGQVLTELKRLSLLRGCDPALAEEWAWGYETQLAEHIQSMSAHDVGRIAARIVVKSSRLGHVHGVEGARWMEAVWHTVLRAVPTARWPRARNEWEELLRWQLNRNGATNRIRSVT